MAPEDTRKLGHGSKQVEDDANCCNTKLLCCCRDVVVKTVLWNGVTVEVQQGIEGFIDEGELDVTLMEASSWQPGDTMDVKLLHVRYPWLKSPLTAPSQSLHGTVQDLFTELALCSWQLGGMSDCQAGVRSPDTHSDIHATLSMSS